MEYSNTKLRIGILKELKEKLEYDEFCTGFLIWQKKNDEIIKRNSNLNKPPLEIDLSDIDDCAYEYEYIPDYERAMREYQGRVFAGETAEMPNLKVRELYENAKHGEAYMHLLTAKKIQRIYTLAKKDAPREGDAEYDTDAEAEILTLEKDVRRLKRHIAKLKKEYSEGNAE